MGDEGRLNFGYAGAGEWARKVDDFSSDLAYAFKTYDIKSQDDVELQAEHHYEIDDLLPPEEFYEDLDVLILANKVSNHKTQFYHAMNYMDDDSIVIPEKALGPRHKTHQRAVVNDELEDGPHFVPTLHYWKKPAAQKAQEVVEDYDLGNIDNVEVVTQEERMDRPWILTPPEGGIVVDFGAHAPELPVVNLDGWFTEEPLNYAVGWDTDSDIENEILARYNEAFEASWNIEGDRFNDDATLKTLVGKNFEQDRKQFLIDGSDDRIGDWSLHGFYGTDHNSPALEFWTADEGLKDYWDLSEEVPAKEAIVDEFMNLVTTGEDPDLNHDKHANIMRGLDAANTEIGLYEDEELNVEEWKGTPKLDYDLLKLEKHF